jgi:hypothetical protein
MNSVNLIYFELPLMEKMLNDFKNHNFMQQIKKKNKFPPFLHEMWHFEHVCTGPAAIFYDLSPPLADKLLHNLQVYLYTTHTCLLLHYTAHSCNRCNNYQGHSRPPHRQLWLLKVVLEPLSVHLA